ncbi:MAG: 1,4-alpha-glucan branching protein domain-containing protein [Acidobacteriota bacterium]
MERGALVIVLHAHLPWVRHPEYPFFLEEHWLFEAITETYLPLIETFRSLTQSGIPLRIAIDVSPTVASMLADPLLKKRAENYLVHLVELCEKELVRTKDDAQFAPVVRFYHERLTRLLTLYRETLGRDILAELSRLESEGVLELATCAATHPLLPTLMDHPGLVRGQIRTAVREHTRLFGRAPRGIWLPECAYAPGVERYLAEADIRWFVVDAHGIEHARPRPRAGVHAPVYTEYGVAAFARDIEPARQVWSAEAGFPGDAVYREFYRDVGWDLPLDYVRPYIDPSGARMFTGLKYYRVTDRKTDLREPYDPEVARKRADEHATLFLRARVTEAKRLAAELGQPPVIVCPYDAELFGHWWFEGPWFLEYLFCKLAYDQDTLSARTPSDVLEAWPEQAVVALGASTWGAGGYFEVWLGASNDWCVPHLAGINARFEQLLREQYGRAPFVDRVLRQMAREMMLAQCSDWTFLISTGTATDYAKRRFSEHVLRFHHLEKMLTDGPLDEEFVVLCEQRDGLFPNLELTDFA